MSFFLKGLVLGFCIAAPVGPIGLLCYMAARLRWAGAVDVGTA